VSSIINKPALFEIEPTNSCNLRCKMCHVNFIKHKTPPTFIDISLIREKLTEAKSRWIVIGSNYEPVLHPKFVDIVKILSDMDCKIDLTTNGTLLKKKVTDQLNNCNIQNVTFSFDSVKKETYERIRGRGFEYTIEKILYFRESFKKDTFFAINVVLMKTNFDELIDIINFWSSYDFHQIRFIFMVMRSLKDEIIKECLYPIRAYVFKRLDEAAEYVIKNNLKITLSSPYFNYSGIKDLYPDNIVGNLVRSDNLESRDYFNPRHHYQKVRLYGMEIECCSPFVFARILWNGDVQLCYRYTIGNLNNKSFEDIWYGERAHMVRRVVTKYSKVCSNCSYFKFCLNSNKINPNDKINYFQHNLVREDERINFDSIGKFKEMEGLKWTPNQD
jgi:radical SAM protein with 4Fe4S-binding SPASM domain